MSTKYTPGFKREAVPMIIDLRWHQFLGTVQFISDKICARRPR